MHIFHRQYVEKQQCNKAEKQKLSFWTKKKNKVEKCRKITCGFGRFLFVCFVFFKQKKHVVLNFSGIM